MAANGNGLAAALIAFQKNPPHIRKEATNPFFNSKYASLDTIMAEVRPVLAEHGLAISQHPTVTEHGVPGLRTILLHESGDRLEDVMPLSVEKQGPQAQGSALTYARRYAVLAVLGLVADEDDDANSAESRSAAAANDQGGTSGAAAETPFQAPKAAQPATDPQRKALLALSKKLGEAGLLDEEQVATLQRAAADPSTSRGQASTAIDRLKKLEKQLEGAAA